MKKLAWALWAAVNVLTLLYVGLLPVWVQWWLGTHAAPGVDPYNRALDVIGAVFTAGPLIIIAALLAWTVGAINVVVLIRSARSLWRGGWRTRALAIIMCLNVVLALIALQQWLTNG